MEIVENANENLLNSQERYFFYIKSQAEQIIKDYNITYAEVMDNKKTYPKFTRKQFIIILEALQERVFKANKDLLFINNSSFYKYDIKKVEMAYKIFKLLCVFYSITPNIAMFSACTGVSEETLKGWLNTGKSLLYNVILQDTENIDDVEMLNSANSILRIYHRNNRQQERLQEGNADILPDLLLPASDQKQLENRDF